MACSVQVAYCTVFLIADHVSADIADRPWFGRVRKGSPKPWSVGRQTMVGRPTSIYLATQFITHIYWVAQINVAKNWCTQMISGALFPILGDR